MKKTAFVYDPFNLRHTLEGHPENYRRLERTWTLLQGDGILDTLIRVESKPVTQDAILRVHTPRYLRRLQGAASLGRLDADTYVNDDSYQASLLSAGGLLSVLGAVMWQQADSGSVYLSMGGPAASTASMRAPRIASSRESGRSSRMSLITSAFVPLAVYGVLMVVLPLTETSGSLLSASTSPARCSRWPTAAPCPPRRTAWRTSAGSLQ